MNISQHKSHLKMGSRSFKEIESVKNKLTSYKSTTGIRKRIGSPKKSNKERLQLGKLTFTKGMVNDKSTRKNATASKLLAQGRSRSPRKAMDKLSKMAARRKRDENKIGSNKPKGGLRNKFDGVFGNRKKTEASLSKMLDRKKSFQELMKERKLIKKRSNEINILEDDNQVVVGSANKDSQLKFYNQRIHRGSLDSGKRKFLSFNSKNKQTPSEKITESINKLKKSTEYFNRKHSLNLNEVKKKSFLSPSKMENTHKMTQAAEKKLGRFKSLKNLVNETLLKDDTLKDDQENSTSKIVFAETPERTGKVLITKSSHKYKMKNSFQDIFKKKYSHQQNIVVDRSMNFSYHQSSLHNIHEEVSNKTLSNTNELNQSRNLIETRTRSNTGNGRLDLQTILNISKSFNIDEQKEPSESSVKIKSSFNFNEISKDESKATSGRRNSKTNSSISNVLDKLRKSRTPDASQIGSSFKKSNFSPVKRKASNMTVQDIINESNTESSHINSSQKMHKSNRNTSFKRLFMPKINSGTRTATGTKTKTKHSSKKSKYISKFTKNRKRKPNKAEELASRQKKMQERIEVLKYNTDLDQNQTVDMFESNNNNRFRSLNQTDLEKQSIETFKDMRGTNKRDSIDTAKEEREYTKGKMLTISEEKSKRKKKSKTNRKSQTQINFQSRLKNLKNNIQDNKFSKIKGLKFNNESSSKRKKSDASALNLNGSFTKKSKRFGNSGQKNKRRSPKVSSSRAVMSKAMDPSEAIFSEKYYMNDLEHYLKTSQNTYYSKLFQDHLKENMNLMKYTLNEYSLPEPNYKVNFNIPEADKRKPMLVLDLDETLVHCFTNDLYDFQQIVPIKQPQGQIMSAKLNIRPFAFEFLKSLKDIYNIVLFTASRQHYADEILKILDPNNTIFKGKLFREHCFQTEKGWHIKDLRIIEGVDLTKTILVDNSASSFGVQPKNGIPIVPYFFEQADIELMNLRNFLFAIEKLIQKKCDVQVMFEKYFKLEKYAMATNFDELKTLLFEE